MRKPSRETKLAALDGFTNACVVWMILLIVPTLIWPELCGRILSITILAGIVSNLIHQLVSELSEPEGANGGHNESHED